MIDELNGNVLNKFMSCPFNSFHLTNITIQITKHTQIIKISIYEKKLYKLILNWGCTWK